MIAVNPYIAAAEPIDGSTWVLHGASIAWDYEPYPDIHTTVGCFRWTVDLTTETLVWEVEGQGNVPTRVPAEEFAATYQATAGSSATTPASDGPPGPRAAISGCPSPGEVPACAGRSPGLRPRRHR